MSFLITGGQGFLGSHIAKHLLSNRTSVNLFDLKKDDRILSQILTSQELSRVNRIYGDISDFNSVKRAVEESKASKIIHLAAYQIPACRVDPIRGAHINVIGTLNVFEAAKQAKLDHIVYASSAAVTGAPGDYKGDLLDNTPHIPRTHYGVFKLANEGNARIYWQDHQISSIGLRPLTVYGVGREVGVTSGPSKAIKAAILGRKYQIAFSGMTSFNFVEDVASYFVGCANSPARGSFALNIKGSVMDVQQFLSILHQTIPASKDLVSIKEGAPSLPLAYKFDESGLNAILPNKTTTSVEDGILKTASHFKRLHQEGLLHADDLD